MSMANSPENIDLVERAGEDDIIAAIFPYLLETLRRRDSRDWSTATVMDLGGGRGVWLKTFQQEGCRGGLLVDIDPACVSFASQHWLGGSSPEWHGLAGSASAIPICHDTVHVVVSRNSLHLWNDQPLACREVFRVLTRGGCTLIGRGFGPDLPEPLHREIKERRKAFRASLGIAGDQIPSPEPEQMAAWFSEAGFQDVEIIPDRKSYWVFGRKPA